MRRSYLRQGVHEELELVVQRHWLLWLLLLLLPEPYQQVEYLLLNGVPLVSTKLQGFCTQVLAVGLSFVARPLHHSFQMLGGCPLFGHLLHNLHDCLINIL